MRNLIIYVSLSLFYSCGHSNSYSVEKVLNGNSIELTNGVTVQLENVSNNQENIKIIERYAKGSILLYDTQNDQINNFSSNKISAVVYNSNGDCLNDLLIGIRQISKNEVPVKEDTPGKDKTVVQMRLENGVYIIPAEINDVSMYFIFDTGASLISISSKEADNLYSAGKLKESDFIGKGQFIDANGDISEGTIINLYSVKIGDRILKDVQACVDQNQNAPLLFGQSALKKFGKVSIDYEKNLIIFE